MISSYLSNRTQRTKIILSFHKQPYIVNDVLQCSVSVLTNTISLSRHEQVCLIRLRFERYPMMGEVSLET